MLADKLLRRRPGQFQRLTAELSSGKHEMLWAVGVMEMAYANDTGDYRNVDRIFAKKIDSWSHLQPDCAQEITPLPAISQPTSGVDLDHTKLETLGASVVTSGESGDLKPASTEPAWRLIQMPKKWPGYRKALWDTLKEMHSDRQNLPIAHQILDKWRIAKPSGIIRVMNDSFEYATETGVQTASLEALAATIKRLIAR